MDYHEIRTLFAKRSGRYDLVDTDWSDNGADFFFNSAQRLLDRLVEHEKSMARSYHILASGSWYVVTEGLMAIKEVWLSDADGKFKLEKKDIAELRDTYYEEPADLTVGTPSFYAPAVLRPYPDASTETTLAAFTDAGDVIASDDGTGHYTYNGVILMPPADGAYTLSIWGKFRSPELSAVVAEAAWTETKSYWTELHPDILLKAALYELEAFYRNTEGAKDWKAILDVDLISLDSMMADQEMSDIQEMEG